MKFLSFLKICIYCQSLYSSKSTLCSYCNEQIINRLEYKTFVNEHGYKVHYLYDWYPRKDDFMSSILILSKKQKCEQFWNVFTKPLASFFYEKIDLFIPSPTKNKSILDHAAMLALGLERQYSQLHASSGTALFSLEKNQTQTQRLRTKQQRLSINIRLATFKLPCKKVNNIMFVDDVITTGNTAKSAINSLKSKFPSSKVEIAVIARRHLDPKII
jgi:predicted amidophosphoribosyltransferase